MIYAKEVPIRGSNENDYFIKFIVCWSIFVSFLLNSLFCYTDSLFGFIAYFFQEMKDW